MSTIYNLSWNETSFLAKLVLFLKSLYGNWENIQSTDSEKQVAGRLAFASTCYSILSSAVAELKSLFKLPTILVLPLSLIWFTFAWLPLVACCYICLIISTNKLMSSEHYKEMSAEQCDVLQSILLQRGYCKEAEQCVDEGLKKQPKSPHTHRLLLIGKAKAIVYSFRTSDDLKKADECAHQALIGIEDTEKSDPQQAIRIYRNCADILDFASWTGENIFTANLRQKAKNLAQKIGAKDQLAKI